MPVHYLHDHPYGGNDSPVGSDIYYATVDSGVDPEDYWPDLFVGRLPARNLDDLRVMIDKIIVYETNLPAGDWQNNVLAASYFQDNNDDGKDDRFFLQGAEIVSDFLAGQGYNMNKIYTTNSLHPQYYYRGEPLPSGLEFNGTTEDVINTINNGVFLVYHRDHGISTNGFGKNFGMEGWGEPEFWAQNAEDLNNGNKLPVFLSINCQSGWFDGETDWDKDAYSADSLGEALIKKSGGGAVAYIGSTRVSYSGYNDELNKGFIKAIWPEFDPYGDDYNNEAVGINHLGAVLNAGKFFMYDKYVVTDAFDYPWSSSFEKTRVEFEEFNLLGDPELELFFGEHDLNILSSFTIDDLQGNGNGVIDPGEIVNLIPTLKSYQADASNVSTTLTLADDPSGCIALNDNSSYFGAIPAGTQITNETDPFQLAVSSSCQAGYEFALNLAITADGYQKTRKLNMQIYENNYEHKWNISDSVNGDGDGKSEPGETINLAVEFWTTHQADDMAVELSRADYQGNPIEDPYVSILNSHIDVGSAEPHEHKNVSFNFTINQDAPHPHLINFTFRIAEEDYNDSLLLSPSIYTFHGNWPLLYYESYGEKSRVAEIDPNYPGLEIIYVDTLDYLHQKAIHSDGTLYWDAFNPISGHIGLISGMAIADINADGYLEMVSDQSHYNTDLVGIYHDGPLSHPPGHFFYYVIGTLNHHFFVPSIADVDPSREGLEIVMGDGDGFVHLLDKSGNLIWKSARIDPDNDPSTEEEISGLSCAIADLENNGSSVEIICAVTTIINGGIYNNRLFALNNNGGMLWLSNELNWHKNYHLDPPVISNLDLITPSLEIVLPEWDIIHIYDSSGNEYQTITDNDKLIDSLATIADINHNSPGPEIITAAYKGASDSYIQMYSARGEKLSEYKLAGEKINDESPILIADINDDDQADILAATDQGLAVINNDFSASQKFNYGLGYYFLIYVGDILGNGKMQVLLMNNNSENSLIDIIEFNGHYNQEKVLWATFQHDNMNTGYYPFEFTCTDADGDGYYLEGECEEIDCDDSDLTINPGAIEICDNQDNDCDGIVDDVDQDNDGFSACGLPTLSDCDDTNPSIHPGVVEICDSFDNNCNNIVDDQCDQDNDDYCVCGNITISSDLSQTCPNTNTSDDWWAWHTCDCNDIIFDIHPYMGENCQDEIDNDCDDLIDWGDPECLCTDADGDGHCTPATGGDDCDDSNLAVNPEMLEDCDNSIDDDCDSYIDIGDIDCRMAVVRVLDHQGSLLSSINVNAHQSDGTYITTKKTDAQGKVFFDLDPPQYPQVYFSATFSRTVVTTSYSYIPSQTVFLPAQIEIYRPERASSLTVLNPDVVAPGRTYLVKFYDDEGQSYGYGVSPVNPSDRLTYEFYLPEDRTVYWQIEVDNPDLTITTESFTPVVNDTISLGSGPCSDQDGDDYGNPASLSCNEPLQDCDDVNEDIDPRAREICDDAIDNDCDSLIDGGDSDCVVNINDPLIINPNVAPSILATDAKISYIIKDNLSTMLDVEISIKDAYGIISPNNHGNNWDLFKGEEGANSVDGIYHEHIWDGTDESGDPLPDGRYKIIIKVTDIGGRVVTNSQWIVIDRQELAMPGEWWDRAKFNPSVGEKATFSYWPSEMLKAVSFKIKKGSEVVMDLRIPKVLAGNQSVVWDGRDANGQLVPPGKYKVVLVATGYGEGEEVNLSREDYLNIRVVE